MKEMLKEVVVGGDLYDNISHFKLSSQWNLRLIPLFN